MHGQQNVKFCAFCWYSGFHYVCESPMLAAVLNQSRPFLPILFFKAKFNIIFLCSIRWSRGRVLAFGTQFADSNPTEAVGFLG